ncbi:MAG TPA: S8 family serine peptidase [Bryobacteraceae bacterium]|nr:S8 family serine peptidase [Bryobacteraceae bacterium]
MTRLSVVSLILLAWTSGGWARGHLAEFALVLQDPPVARTVHSRAGLRSAQAQNQLVKIRTAQRAVLSELGRRKIPVNGSVQTLLNAIFVTAPRDQAAELAKVPGVARVQYLPPVHRDLDQAAGLINAPQAWSAVGGAANAGAGVKIAIVDTGIDQAHPGFQSSASMPPGFPKGDTGYTNNKVIVARSYISQLTQAELSAQPPIPDHPDDTSPRDRVGHGTAIAMIAAGVSNKGPLATIQGIAPGAYLGNYKIFGSPGVNDSTLYSVLAQALEDALNDGMDIAALALGEGDPALYGPLDSGDACFAAANEPCDVRAALVENLTSMGLTVVTAAGNDGNTASQVSAFNTIHTPGTAPSVITVGATTNSHRFASTLHVAGGSDVDGVFGDGRKISAPLTAPMVDVATLGNDGLACAALPGGSLTGAVALIQRGNCSFSDKINNAAGAGAIAAVIYQVAGSEDLPSSLGAQDTGIPAMTIGNSEGQSLKQFLASHQGTKVTLDPALHALSSTADVVAGFSSRGPDIGTNSIKPELVAPGVGIYTATQKFDPNGDLYNATGYVAASGTSFSVGMVAGAAAIVKQQHSQFTPAQIKSALVNTASGNVIDESGPARIYSAGAGKLNVGDAIKVGATVAPATLSFGVIGAATLPVKLALTLTNTSNATATFQFTIRQVTADSRAAVQPPASVTLAAGASTDIAVNLTGSQPSPGIYDGFLDITSNDGSPTLHVPYNYAVGDGVPYNYLPVEGSSLVSQASDPETWELSFRVIDRYGVPVVGIPVSWSVVSGGGSVQQADTQTYALGFAAAEILVGPQLGDQVFRATAAGVNMDFDVFARPVPTISSGGVVDAASGKVGQGVAPGSYISIFGSGLAGTLATLSTPYLPVSLADVSVSFDAPGISLPGYLEFVSPNQVNVQIPWELQGQSSVSLKVSVGDIQSAAYTVPLATYLPAVFQYNSVLQEWAAALDANFGLITPGNPAQRGKVIQIYVNGLGPVSNQPPSGEATPAQPFSMTSATPTVRIGGVDAPVSFSGLAPGIVGLYQINVTVPEGAPTGTQPLVVSVNGIDSATARLPVQ